MEQRASKGAHVMQGWCAPQENPDLGLRQPARLFRV
jgi:hypothetical protein